MPFVFLSAIWLGFWIQSLGFIHGCEGAIIPLSLAGLPGIIFSPFLHGGFEHIIGNSIPLVILSFLLYEFYPKAASKVMLYGWLLSGAAVWATPQISFFAHRFYIPCIIGASGVIYVIAFFLFFSGIVRRNIKMLTVSFLVAVYYGGMIWGMIPEELMSAHHQMGQISWQSHLAGAVIGTLMAFIYQKYGEQRHKYIWQYPHYYNEMDDLLWQKYKAEHPEDFFDEPRPPKKKDPAWEYLDELLKRKS